MRVNFPLSEVDYVREARYAAVDERTVQRRHDRVRMKLAASLSEESS